MQKNTSVLKKVQKKRALLQKNKKGSIPLRIPSFLNKNRSVLNRVQKKKSLLNIVQKNTSVLKLVQKKRIFLKKVQKKTGVLNKLQKKQVLLKKIKNTNTGFLNPVHTSFLDKMQTNKEGIRIPFFLKLVQKKRILLNPVQKNTVLLNKKKSKYPLLFTESKQKNLASFVATPFKRQQNKEGSIPSRIPAFLNPVPSFKRQKNTSFLNTVQQNIGIPALLNQMQKKRRILKKVQKNTGVVYRLQKKTFFLKKVQQNKKIPALLNIVQKKRIFLNTGQKKTGVVYKVHKNISFLKLRLKYQANLKKKIAKKRYKGYNLDKKDKGYTVFLKKKQPNKRMVSLRKQKNTACAYPFKVPTRTIPLQGIQSTQSLPAFLKKKNTSFLNKNTSFLKKGQPNKG